MTAAGRCRGCGKEIEWGVNERGQRIPLDPRPPVYETVEFGADGENDVIRRLPKARVSHFATCPKAAQFSGRNRVPVDRSGAGEPPANTTPTVGGRRRSPTTQGGPT